MNIECPSCRAAYEVPDDRLGSRRLLRCGACRHEWPVGRAEPVPDAGPAEPEEAPVVDSAPAVAAPEDRLAPPRPAPKRDMLLTGAWIASVALILCLGTGVYAWRADVVAAWPPAGRILSAAPHQAVTGQHATGRGEPQE